MCPILTQGSTKLHGAITGRVQQLQDLSHNYPSGVPELPQNKG